MNLNFVNSVISIESLKKADLEIIQKAKRKGKKEAHKIRFIKKGNDKVDRALEVVNGSLYNNYNIAEKLIIMSNIIFVNDETFVDSIIGFGFNEENIYLLNDLINKIRLLKKQNPDIKINHELLDKIINISKKYFGITCPNIIINKMNELVVTNPELFKKQEKKNQKVLAIN